MSHPAIYIALQGTTPNVPPRYTGPGSARPRPAPAPAVPGYMARSLAAVFRIPHTPYGIRNSEIGIRKPGNPESWCGRVGQSHPPWSHEFNEMLVVWMLRLGLIKRLLKKLCKLLLELPRSAIDGHIPLGLFTNNV